MRSNANDIVTARRTAPTPGLDKSAAGADCGTLFPPKRRATSPRFHRPTQPSTMGSPSSARASRQRGGAEKTTGRLPLAWRRTSQSLGAPIWRWRSERPTRCADLAPPWRRYRPPSPSPPPQAPAAQNTQPKGKARRSPPPRPAECGPAGPGAPSHKPALLMARSSIWRATRARRPRTTSPGTVKHPPLPPEKRDMLLVRMQCGKRCVVFAISAPPQPRPLPDGRGGRISPGRKRGPS